MTLDEAIKHCKEKAKELRLEAEQVRDIGEVVSSTKQPYNEPVKACLECAKEHEQLAEWLEELKEWRKLRPVCAFDGYVVYKSRTEASDISDIEGYCDTCKHNDGYPTSAVCQGCVDFIQYERGGAEMQKGDIE